MTAILEKQHADGDAMSKFVEINTNELVGLALDWAIGQFDPVCEGVCWEIRDGVMFGVCKDDINSQPVCFLSKEGFVRRFQISRETDSIHYSPSTEWSRCGPLIEKYGIRLERSRDGHSWFAGWMFSASGWNARYEMFDGEDQSGSSSALVAACRAIVASCLGETVKVPKDLCKHL